MSAVRRVLDSEYSKYCDHLKALDADSKYLRFGYPIQDQMIDQLCKQFAADCDQNILFCIENDNLEFVAVGHIAFQADEMELAFSVLKQCQGQGLGNQLFRRVIQWCRTHNQLRGSMMCLSSNMVVRHLCTKYGIQMKSSGGETMASIELDHPNIVTYFTEAADSNLAAMDYMGKRFVHSFKHH